MAFNTLVKALEFGVLQHAGIPVTPEQLHLTVKNPAFGATGSGFSSHLNTFGLNGTPANASSLTLQPPPVPPTDPNDIQAQNLYQQQLAAYNARLMQVLLLRMSQQQQAQIQASRTQSSASSSASTSASSVDASPSSAGVGGIF